MSVALKTPSGARAIEVRQASRVMEISWEDGTRSDLPFALLRGRCRCAECESTARRGRPLAAHDEVTVVAVRPVGAYAVQVVFSDGHDRGIFPFVYLRELGGVTKR